MKMTENKDVAHFLAAVRSGRFEKALAGNSETVNEGWWQDLQKIDKQLIKQGDVPGISSREDYERYCDWLMHNEMFPHQPVRKADQDDGDEPEPNRYFRNGTIDRGQDLTADSVHSVAAAIVRNWKPLEDAAKKGLGELIQEFESVLRQEGVDKQPAAQKYMKLARRQLNKNMVFSLIAGIVHLGSNRYNSRIRAYDKDPDFKHRGEKYVQTDLNENSEAIRDEQIEFWAHMLDEAMDVNR